MTEEKFQKNKRIWLKIFPFALIIISVFTILCISMFPLNIFFIVYLIVIIAITNKYNKASNLNEFKGITKKDAFESAYDIHLERKKEGYENSASRSSYDTYLEKKQGVYNEIHRANKETNEKEEIRNNKNIYSVKVVGTSYRQKEIKQYINDSYLDENYDFTLTKKEIEELYVEDEKIFEYEFSTVNDLYLLPEPDNKYDSNAIKVMASVSGIDYHLGYIPANECKKIKSLIDNHPNPTIKGTIGGGKYKYLSYNYETDKYNIRRGTKDYFISLEISY